MNEATLRTLCRWACTFNSWGWPGDYPHPPPHGFESLPDHAPDAPADKSRCIRPHADAIARIVPRKEYLRHWNTAHIGHGRMTDGEFERWYAESGPMRL